MLQVLILAEDSLVRAGLAFLINQSSRLAICGQIAPGSDITLAIELYRPQVILWDTGILAQVNERDLSGLPPVHPPVLALVVGLSAAGSALAAGASGCLDRQASKQLLEAGIYAVFAGLYVLEPRFTIKPLLALPEPAHVDVLPEPLTRRETQVLQALARGLTNKEIAYELGISENTVKFHINGVLGKLGASSRTDAALRAARMGLIPL